MLKKITIKDKVYGTHYITESVIIDLLKSKPILRLKNISQFGVPDQYYHIKNYNRYEHSVGVMILIKSLGGSLEEQIAGLLHDVSHTAFSHVIDWVIGEAGDETYQDTKHEDIVGSGEIGRILKKYKYNPKAMSDYHNFKLLERDIPELCADRVDYSLREFPSQISKPLFKALVNKNNTIIFKDKRSANIFAINFLKLQMNHWGGFEAVSRYKLFSNVLRIAIKEGTLNFKDFLNDEKFVINKLLKTKNKEAKAILKILKNKKLATSKNSEIVQKKFRHTDPCFLDINGVHKLSEVDNKFKDYLAKQRLANTKGIKVPILFS